MHFGVYFLLGKIHLIYNLEPQPYMYVAPISLIYNQKQT